jgi:hypothetical protein
VIQVLEALNIFGGSHSRSLHFNAAYFFIRGMIREIIWWDTITLWKTYAALLKLFFG